MTPCLWSLLYFIFAVMEYGVKERRHSWIVSLGDLVIPLQICRIILYIVVSALYCTLLKSAPIQTNELNYWKVLNDEQKMYSFWNNARAQNNVQNTDIDQSLTIRGDWSNKLFVPTLQRSNIFGKDIIIHKICMLELVDCTLCLIYIPSFAVCRVLFLLRLLINPFNVKSMGKWRNIGHIDQTQDGTQWVVWLEEEEDEEENVTIWWYSPVRSL